MNYKIIFSFILLTLLSCSNTNKPSNNTSENNLTSEYFELRLHEFNGLVDRRGRLPREVKLKIELKKLINTIDGGNFDINTLVQKSSLNKYAKQKILNLFEGEVDNELLKISLINFFEKHVLSETFIFDQAEPYLIEYKDGTRKILLHSNSLGLLPNIYLTQSDSARLIKHQNIEQPIVYKVDEIAFRENVKPKPLEDGVIGYVEIPYFDGIRVKSLKIKKENIINAH